MRTKALHPCTKLTQKTVQKTIQNKHYQATRKTFLMVKNDKQEPSGTHWQMCWYGYRSTENIFDSTQHIPSHLIIKFENICKFEQSLSCSLITHHTTSFFYNSEPSEDAICDFLSGSENTFTSKRLKTSPRWRSLVSGTCRISITPL